MVVFVLLMETTETTVWFEQVAYITSLPLIFFLTVYHSNLICIHVFILVYLVSIHSLSKIWDANLSLSRNSCFCYVIFFLGFVCLFIWTFCHTNKCPGILLYRVLIPKFNIKQAWANVLKIVAPGTGHWYFILSFFFRFIDNNMARKFDSWEKLEINQSSFR